MVYAGTLARGQSCHSHYGSQAPFIPGMDMSMITTSNCRRSTSSQAAFASPFADHLHIGLGVEQGFQSFANDHVVASEEDPQISQFVPRSRWRAAGRER
jgi:hypothetical protein